MKNRLAASLFLLPFGGLLAQPNPTDTLPKALETVEITATRLTLTDLKAPLAVTVLDKNRLQTATQQLSPYEVLSAVPGVFAMNPDNFAQDLRISIRGFGARAAFGIRGIRIFTDGLPEGTPDGQADVDNLDIGIVQQMEILRGAASGLYGNAAGGVIYMTTENAPTNGRLLLEAQASVGSYDFQRFQLKIGQKHGKFGYFLNGSYNHTEGYRAWSQMQNTILNGKFSYQFAPQTKLTVLLNYGNSPTANDAGGLTVAQISDNPRQAAANNLLFETGEAVTQSRIGATFETRFSKKHSLQARLFYTARDFQNRLAVVANGYGILTRQYGGGGVNYQFEEKIAAMPYRLKLGIDIENQADTRQRYAYLKVVADGKTTYKQDKIVLNQLETFRSTGVYLLQDLQPTERLLLSFGIRYDDLRLAATDFYLADGDQSGSRQFQKINPTAGVNYEIFKNVALYANYSSTFESPTLNELSNNPDGMGGFNANLAPQQAQSFEIGTKGRIAVSKGRDETDGIKGLHFDVAVFHIETKNDLVPYQIAGQTGKTFYRNAGETLRKGIEIGLTYPILKGLTAHLTQTFSDFQYKTYAVNTTVFDGKTLPGIPKTQTQIELRYAHSKGFFAILQARNVGQVFANDDNTASADSYSVVNVRLGSVFSLKFMTIEPFFGINNLTDTHYIANVLLNAASDRFFEPAALRYFFGGIKFRLK